MIRQIGNATLYRGLCLEFLRDLAEASVDAIVCDPPYGLSFMGKKWDYDVPSVDVWSECLRVLKPGGHLLAFAGTRTQHRMAVRIEDAGFEIRDMISWVYGSGFPKSLDVSKAIDKAAGAEREVLSERQTGWTGTLGGKSALGGLGNHPDVRQVTAPATDAARQWQGWGTALKPSLEPVTVARKPLAGNVADNVLRHGTGGLNIDGCRIKYLPDERVQTFWNSRGSATINTAEQQGSKPKTGEDAYDPSKGRWPANLIHDGSEEVLAAFPQVKGATSRTDTVSAGMFHGGIAGTVYNDGANTSAARFFYCAKASKRDRDEGCEGLEAIHRANGNKWTDQDYRVTSGERPPSAESGPRRNHHPTVKPTDLMRYLCRLVTPPGGVVLDPFMGSGSTGKAAALEGFRFIGCERESEYFDIACRRIELAYAQGKLFQEPAPKGEQVPMWG